MQIQIVFTLKRWGNEKDGWGPPFILVSRQLRRLIFQGLFFEEKKSNRFGLYCLNQGVPKKGLFHVKNLLTLISNFSFVLTSLAKMSTFFPDFFEFSLSVCKVIVFSNVLLYREIFSKPGNLVNFKFYFSLKKFQGRSVGKFFEIQQFYEDRIQFNPAAVLNNNTPDTQNKQSSIIS